MRAALRVAADRGPSGVDRAYALGLMEDLFDYVPNDPAARLAVGDMLALARDLASDGGSGDDELDGDLSDEAMARRRYRFELTSPWDRLGAYWGRGMQLAFDLLPDRIQPEVMDILRSIRVWEMPSGSSLRKILKELTNVAKKHGALAFPWFKGADWKYLINWDNLGDFATLTNWEDAKNELSEWATGYKEHKAHGPLGYTEEQFLVYFREGVRRFLALGEGVDRANENAVSINEFAALPTLWMTSGSTSRRSTAHYVDRNGNVKRVRKNKNESAMEMSAQEVERILRTRDVSNLTASYKAIPKRELGKVRWVISAPLEMHLRQTYVANWLDDAMSGHPFTPLYMSRSQILDMWDRLEVAVRDIMVAKIPIDQAHFDWQQTKEMIGVALEEIDRYMRVHLPPALVDDYAHVMEGMMVELVSTTGSIKLDQTLFKEASGDVEIPVEKGVMSGWRLTSLLDTMMNMGELHAAQENVLAQGGVETVIQAFGQGDDDDVLSPSYGTAAALAISYEQMNFEVNPAKFFISIERDEFLRQVIVPGDISGYMIRGVPAVVTRNPISRDPPAGVLRLRQQTSQWNMLLSRGADPDRVRHHAVNDIASGNGLSHEEATRILATPVALGGAGWLGGVWSWGNVEPLAIDEGRDEKKFRIVGTDFPGLNTVYELVKSYGLRPTRDSFVQYFGRDLDAPDAEREITPGEVYDPPDIFPFGWQLKEMGVAYPVSARARREINPQVASYMLLEALEHWRKSPSGEKAFWVDWINIVWLDDYQKEFSTKLKTRGGNRVWIDWLTGKLPWGKPVVQGWSSTLISSIYDLFLNDAWRRLNDMQSFNMTMVARAALTVEIHTTMKVQEYPYHLGN